MQILLRNALLFVAMGVIAIPAVQADDTPKEEPKATIQKEEPKEGDKDEPKEEELSPGAKILEEIKEVAAEPPKSKEEFIERLKTVREIARRAMKAEEKGSDVYEQASSLNDAMSARLIGLLPPEEQKAELDKFIAGIEKKGELTRNDIGLMMNVARGLPEKEAAAMNKKFAALARKAGEEDLAERFEGAARRADLLGNEMVVKGKTFEGESFSLADLKGKVVLVDFWATWCGPCIAEYPNMKKNYEKYHDAGFEIVGISLDRDRDALANYLEKKEVPWITLHDEENPGKADAADYYGVSGIPTMILVGKDGKVISLHARGGTLTKLLEDQFGSGEATDEEVKKEEVEEKKEATPKPTTRDN